MAGLLNKDELLAIENRLYEPKKEELVARTFLNVNTSFAPYAGEIGYNWLDFTGSAAILAAGASAKDVPFVGEKSHRETLKVYSIVTGIRYTAEEIMASRAQANLGKGPSCSLDMIRVSAARRYIAEMENKIAFIGNKEHNIKGILNHPGIQSVDVEQGSTGSNATEKRLWKNKKPQEILNDLRTAKAAVEKDGYFNARVLILDTDHYNMLLKPYSDMSPMTTLQWLQSEGAFFQKIIKTSAVSKKHNGLAGDVDSFLILDNDPEVVELAIVKDIELGNPIPDLIDTHEQAVKERLAGCIIRHPSAIYVGKGC